MMLLMNVCIAFADTTEFSNTNDSEIKNIIVDENNALFIPDTSILTANNLILLGTGYCTGDGVKLKSAPSASGITLGLMYKGEAIKVYD